MSKKEPVKINIIIKDGKYCCSHCLDDLSTESFNILCDECKNAPEHCKCFEKMEKRKLEQEEYKKFRDALKQRFPNSRFSINCFDKIEEIENKILVNNEDFIIIRVDSYPKTFIQSDYYTVHSKLDRIIYYKNVIDVLVENDNTTDIYYMERIKQRGINNFSAKVFSTGKGRY